MIDYDKVTYYAEYLLFKGFTPEEMQMTLIVFYLDELETQLGRVPTFDEFISGMKEFFEEHKRRNPDFIIKGGDAE